MNRSKKIALALLLLLLCVLIVQVGKPPVKTESDDYSYRQKKSGQGTPRFPLPGRDYLVPAGAGAAIEQTDLREEDPVEKQSKLESQLPNIHSTGVALRNQNGTSTGGGPQEIRFAYVRRLAILPEKPTEAQLARFDEALKAAAISMGVDFIFARDAAGSRGFPLLIYARDSLDATEQVIAHFGNPAISSVTTE